MKKIFLVLFCSFCFSSICNAECDYKTIVEMNTLASYVEISYKYDDSTGKFTLTFVNVPDSLYIKLNDFKYEPNNNMIVINDLMMGQKLDGYIFSSKEIECLNEYLRPINITLPFLNTYFGSSECIGHENLDVCSYKFLNYQVSSYTFHKLIEENLKEIKDNKDNKDDLEKVENKSFFETILDYAKKISIPLLLVVVTSLITFSICNIIYRKVRHGL